jgi:hypothetical protein
VAFRPSNPHRSGDGLCDPYRVPGWRIVGRVEQRRTNPTSLVEVRRHLIDFCLLFIDHRKYQPKRTRTRYAFVPTARNSGAHSVCPDDHHDGDDDYQEVNTLPPESVLDVYRQAATSGDPGSRGLNVLDQLAA